MSSARAGGRRLAFAALAALVPAACGGGDGATSLRSTIVDSPTSDESALPIDERDDARDAVRTTDLAVTVTSTSGLEITITNLGPNPADGVVVRVATEQGSLVVDDDRCVATTDGFRCALTEILARDAASISFRGAPSSGTVTVEHDGPEQRPDDNTVSF